MSKINFSVIMSQMLEGSEPLGLLVIYVNKTLIHALVRLDCH